MASGDSMLPHLCVSLCFPVRMGGTVVSTPGLYGLTEIVCAKHLTQCLTYGKFSVSSSRKDSNDIEVITLDSQLS